MQAELREAASRTEWIMRAAMWPEYWAREMIIRVAINCWRGRFKIKQLDACYDCRCAH